VGPATLRRSGVKRLAAVLMTLAVWSSALLVWQGVVSANNWGGRITDCDTSVYSQCVAKNGYVDYWFSSDFDSGPVGPSFRGNLRVVFEEQFDQHPNNNGDIKTWEAPKSFADVRLRYKNDPAGFYAWTQCTASAVYDDLGTSKAWCEPAKIVFNKRFPARFDTWQERKAYGCHEMGHVFGLRHTTNTTYCMENPPTGATRTLKPHDMKCLKLYYPLVQGQPFAWDCP